MGEVKRCPLHGAKHWILQQEASKPRKREKKQVLGGTGGGEREVEGKGEKKPMGGIKSKIFKRIIDP